MEDQKPRRVGRPLKFESVEELQEKIDAYFADCDPHLEETTEWVEARQKDGQLKKDEHGLNFLVKVTHKIMTKQKPYTITGLALALDTSRETLLEYAEREEYVDTIKAAKDKCQSFVEHTLFTAANVTGAIFNLKNNYGWKDKTETDLTSGGDKIETGFLAAVEKIYGKDKDGRSSPDDSEGA